MRWLPDSGLTHPSRVKPGRLPTSRIRESVVVAPVPFPDKRIPKFICPSTLVPILAKLMVWPGKESKPNPSRGHRAAKPDFMRSGDLALPKEPSS